VSARDLFIAISRRPVLPTSITGDPVGASEYVLTAEVTFFPAGVFNLSWRS
jgi:hypothetical protein